METESVTPQPAEKVPVDYSQAALVTRCSIHPHYQAIRKPRVPCPACDQLWWLKHNAAKIVDFAPDPNPGYQPKPGFIARAFKHLLNK